VEPASDEQGPQQEPQSEDALTNLFSPKTLEETPAHLANGHARCGTPKHEKSVIEKSQAGEKTGCPIPAEKVNGSAIHDKGKRTRGESPFTKQEREEMEALLDELCGHLGQPSKYSAAPHALADAVQLTVIYPTRFLESEDVANNFLFNTDRLLPLPIYD
jgi:phospholipase D1/2